MQPLDFEKRFEAQKAEAAGLECKSDPAPSRFAYRLNRFFLTPLFCLVLLRIAPASLLLVTGMWLFMQPGVAVRVQLYAKTLYTQLQNLPEYRVNTIDIIGASSETSDEILRALSLNLPVSVLDLDLRHVEQTTHKINAVRSARVSPPQNGVLEIHIVERRPALRWYHPEGAVLIDAEGVELRQIKAANEYTNLGLIAGWDAEKKVSEALDLFAIAAPLGGRVIAIKRIGSRRWDMLFKGDITIKLPEYDARGALKGVIALHQRTKLLERDVSVIDTRLKERLIVRIGVTAQKELQEYAQF